MTNIDNSYLMVKCKMWEKEENNLIQYDICNKICQRFKIFNNSYLIRSENNIEIIDLKNQKFYNNKLFSFEKKNNDFFIKINKIKPNLLEIPFQNCAYLVYKGFPTEQLIFNEKLKYKRYYKLNEGDIIKLGKVYLKIHKINLKSIKKINILNLNDSSLTLLNNNSVLSIKINGQEIIKGVGKNKSFNKKNILIYNKENNLLNNSMKNDKYKKLHKSISLPKIFPQNIILNKNQKILEFSSKNLIKKNCRICFSNESNDSNPLLSPCKCDGSLKYIHYKCLKNWINAKINNDSSISEDDLVISYDSKDIKCEICKEKFPDYIYYHNKYYNIKFYSPSFKKYLILESFRNDIYQSNFFHIISLENKNVFIIGRAEEADFCIPELSISRYHCFLHIQNNEIYLEDNGSKFGSLVLLQNSNIKMIEKYKLKLQINSIYFNIKLIKPFSLFSCCSVNEENNIYYQLQNSKKINIFNSLNIVENIDDADNIIFENYLKNQNEIKIKKIKINSNKEKKNLPLIDELSTEKNYNNIISNQDNLIKIPIILKK